MGRRRPPLANLPFRAAHVRALAEAGIRTVIALCEDHEYRGGQRAEVEAAYAAHGIREHRLHVEELGVPSSAVFQRAVSLFQEAVGRGERGICVHCRGGRERSAVVAAAIRMSETGEDAEHAVAAIGEIAPTARPLPHQREALRRWSRG